MGSATALATGLAGCNTDGATTEPETGDGAGTATASPTPTEAAGETDAAAMATLSVETAVAAEWNAMRARVYDALALGVAEQYGAGGEVAGAVFARFENAGGEYGAHEMLESTEQAAYENFEEALGELRTEGLDAENIERAREEATLASEALASAQTAVTDEPTVSALNLQLLGARVRDAGMLARLGAFSAAGTVASDAMTAFEEAAVHDALEAADSEAYERFESAVEETVAAAEGGDAEGVRTAAATAFDAALSGSYAVAGVPAVAGTGHMAALQAQGWDAASLAGTGGPSTGVAHAAALTVYRARAADAHWLAAAGETDRAATVAGDVFAHFEGARAHEALEAADGQAYEGFETGLSELRTAIENGNSDGIDAAVATVDENLVAGIEALAGEAAPVLEATYFRARLADARERYRLGQNNVAAGIGQSLFQRFEANELGMHEAVEATSESLYESFEEEHLAGLIDAFENTDDSGVSTHYDGATGALAEYASEAADTATVSAGEAALLAARGFDAAALDALGKDSRAAAIVQEAFGHFEAGAGGFHEAIEAADESLYESFEEALGAVGDAASNGDAAYPPAKTFNDEALGAAYAVVAAGGSGGNGEGAAAIMQEAFAHFEEARVHELIEDADRSAYGSYEGALDAYITALNEGGDVDARAEGYARASQYAAFALADAVEELPLALTLAGTGGGDEGESDGETDSSLSGGPNVVEGVPDDADHVVDMQAVAFEPKELTVSVGDTVAFPHRGGEAHTVFADEAEIPGDASYWASGGFESQSAAESGWEDGQGAVQSGQSYVHTFETVGTHSYYCAPHEAAGMVGTITVEE